MTVIKNVIMPVLGMSQDSGTILKWLATEGQFVRQGDPLIEVETDKAAAEIEAPATGYLAQISAQEGQSVPVSTVIALIVDSLETPAVSSAQLQSSLPSPGSLQPKTPVGGPIITASPVAARMAADHKLDLALIRPQGGRVEKAEVLAYIASMATGSALPPGLQPLPKIPASPKARRLAANHGIEINSLQGSGPGGAVLVSDVSMSIQGKPSPTHLVVPLSMPPQQPLGVYQSTTWRIMAEHTTASWVNAPHFYLMREVDASRLISWHATIQKNATIKITYSDLLVRLTAAALIIHPNINALVQNGSIEAINEVNIGLAVAVDHGLVVPVIHRANELGITEIATLRSALVEKAQNGKLRPDDISGGTFTVSNLGMFGVDAFQAILNSPQAAILAVGRIADRVVPLNGTPVIRPMMVISVSFDHRAVDGARGARFLETLAELIEEPAILIV